MATGPAGSESVLVGMSDGGVFRVFIDNPFPMELIKIEHPVRSVDLSRDGKKLVVIDSTRMCLVYNLVSNELIFSVSFVHNNYRNWIDATMCHYSCLFNCSLYRTNMTGLYTYFVTMFSGPECHERRVEFTN